MTTHPVRDGAVRGGSATLTLASFITHERFRIVVTETHLEGAEAGCGAGGENIMEEMARGISL